MRATILTVLLLASASAEAGVRYTTTSESGDGTAETTTLLVDSGRMRVDSVYGEKTTVIFDGDQMTIVDYLNQSYMVMDAATIEQMASQMSQAMAQMEKVLQAMPKEQREQMRQMMAQQMGQMGQMGGAGEPLPQPEVVDLDTSDSVGDISCRWKEIRRGGELETKICVGDWNDLPGGEEMLEVQEGLVEFTKSLQQAFTEGAPPMLSQAFRGDAFESVSLGGGFPLITERYSAGQRIERSTFTGSETVTATDADFAPPQGFTETSLGPGMGMGSSRRRR